MLGGTYNGTMTVGSTTINGAGVLLVESDTATGVINLVKAITGAGIITSDIKINPVDGSIFICGSTSSDLNPGTALGKSGKGLRDGFIMKLDASYNHLWTAFIGGVENDNITGLTLDPITGDAYVTGIFNSPTLYLNAAGGTTWGASVIATNSNSTLPITSDIFVAKFGSAGAMQWITKGGSSSTVANDNVFKGIVYQNGSVYLGCLTPTNSTFTWGSSSIATTSTGPASTSDIILMKLDPSTGASAWIKTWGGNNADVITSLAAGNGKIYVGGYSSSVSGISFGGTPFVTLNNNDAFVFAVDADGTEQSRFMQLKGNSSDIINEIKLDAVGNIFFAGQTSSINLPVANSFLSTAGNSDILLGSIDPESMLPKFGFLSGSVQNEGGNTITPGAVGMVFVGGNLLGTATFGNQVLNGRLGGDFVYARVDYPFQAPGAQNSNMNAWFKTNAALIGNPATTWLNSFSNSSLTTLASTGSVPLKNAGVNYNPSVSITGGTNYLSQSGIYAANFLDPTGSKYSIYTVYKPTASTDKLTLWNETGTGTGLNLAVTSSAVTGSGGLKSIAKTAPLPLNQFSMDALVVNGGTMNSYLNGKNNGTQTGATAVSTVNSGAFQINGTGNFEVAEVVVYGGAHTTGQSTMNQINTYLAIKYGITLSHHYFSTVGDTLFKVDGTGTTYLYDNNIAGIGIDSNELLIQKQGISQNTLSNGNMLTIGMDTIANSIATNIASAGSGISYLVWGDNASSVTASQSTDMPLTVSSCAYRLPREWKVNRTGSGIGNTQVKFDLNSTITLSGLAAADLQLMIDEDGDGDFTTGTCKLVNAADFTGNIATFNNIVWDADGNGTDVFTLLINNKLPKVALMANAATKPAFTFSCPDVAGTLILLDNLTTPAEKYLAIYPNANTGYNFSATALNNNPQINNQRKTNGATATSALSNRMYIINDAGTNNYPSGMKLRLYYDPADSIAAVNAMDPAVNGTVYYKWFKKSNATPADVMAAQTVNGISGGSLLTASAYGKENGVSYVEFEGINSFSIFGAIAIRTSGVLPIKLQRFTGTNDHCTHVLHWETSDEQNLQYFDIQYSTDGTHFGSLVHIKGKGTNNPTRSTYTWNNPKQSARGFYRLSMVSSDGVPSYSQVVTLYNPACGDNSWSALPNPVIKGQPITIRINATSAMQSVKVILTNLQGQQLLSKDVRMYSGQVQVNIPTAGFARGTYMISVNDATGNSLGQVQKVIIT